MSPWDEIIEGTLTAGDVMRILLAVATGKTTVQNLGNGQAIVKFTSLDGLTYRVTATMEGSERTAVSLDAE